VPFREAVDDPHHALAHDAEISAVQRNRDRREAAEDAVESIVRQALQKVLLTPLPNRVHHVKALVELAVEVLEHFGRVLKVAVQHGHGPPCRMAHPRSHSRLVAEIP